MALGFDTSPEYFDLTVNPNRYENIGGVVRNCLIRNTAYAGIAFYVAKNASAFNNTLVSTAQSDHSPIYFGVSLQDWEPDTDPNDGIGYRPASVNIHVENNVVLQDASIPTPVVFIRTFYHEGDVGRVNGMEGMPIMDHNCYWCGTTLPVFTDQRPDFELNAGSFSQWQTHIGTEVHTLVDNPLLDSSYRPTEGSPCIDAGDWNGPTCRNTSDTGVSVTLTAYVEGVSVGVQTVSLAPKENLVDVIGPSGSLLNSLGLHDFDMIRVQTSSSVLSGLNISGDGQEKLVFTSAVNVN